MGSLVDLVNEITYDSRLLPGGVRATVTPPNGSPISTSGVWIDPDLLEAPAGGEFRRREGDRILGVRRDHIPSAPRGTTVVAPLAEGELDQCWRVDSADRFGTNTLALILIPEPD